MLLQKIAIVLLLAIPPAALSPATILAQQSQTYTGKVTELRIIPMAAATYQWTLYCDSTADYARTTGKSDIRGAGFVNGINDQPSVQVKWNTPGTFFFKILVIDSNGCSNFKVGIIEVLPDQITARIYPNPVNGNDLNFELTMPDGNLVTIDIYSPNRQLISRIFEEYLPGGVTKTIHYRNYLPQGIYTYRITTKNQVCSGRIICIRVY